MPKWNFIPVSIPSDAQTVYVRLYNGYSDVFKAVYNSTAQTFTMDTTFIVFPIWMIAKWKSII